MLSFTNRKAKISKTKIMASTIAIILMLSISASLVLLPSANAHTPSWQIPTYAYIVAEPNPVGVGQSINVYMWLDALYGSAGGSGATLGTNGSTSSGALLSNSWRFITISLL